MRTMRTTRMGSARPTTDMQPPQSQPQPQPQLKPSLDVLPAEDDTLRITASRELLTHAQLLGQPEDPNPTAHQTAEAFHPLQRPQGHRVSSQNGAGQPGQQTTVGQTPALATSHGMLYGAVPATKSYDDAGCRERVVDNALVVNICDRKVRLTSDWDDSSLYSLCRRWVRNDVSRKDQMKSCHGMIPIPKPLPRITTGSKENEHRTVFSKAELQTHVKTLTEAELLQHHVENFKNVRKRAREHRLDRISRFKPRLCLLFPSV
ncbi:hypothetical protein O6H91_07G095200 [Diphasiastrum complanatum]|uniref:Uncharacterized protein n=1 Tax=Diphasiastrum complanatum TaxID=34168 RepID=A0ACC2D871_DIPCM|nr:hypothetical protein O6H91_07G095200 [Diphasiastrum complanatum]